MKEWHKMGISNFLAPNLESEELQLTRSPISAIHYELVRKKLGSLCGIELGDNKQALVESRLMKRLSSLKLKDIGQYIRYLEKTPEEETAFINCLTTNKTDWFREPKHFSYLVNQVLPELYKTSDETIYLWSAASSTGEEVYTLAMAMNEHIKPGYDFRILGTDIDTDILAKAKAAIYRSEMVKSQVPFSLQSKYFIEDADETKDLVRVCPELCAHTKFRNFNLIESTLPVDIRFDVIFLRNVLIYFTPSTIEQVIARLCKNLKPGGYLFIGHSESLSSISHSLVQVSESVYRLKG